MICDSGICLIIMIDKPCIPFFPLFHFQPEASTEEGASKKSRKSKKIDKEALAKKLMRKKIFVNSKIVFNEEGEVDCAILFFSLLN